MSQNNNESCIAICNSLLAGEISAVETYGQAIEKFAGEITCDTLNHSRDRHAENVAKLRENVVQMGGEPATDSGLWGEFAKTIEGAAKLLGKTAALGALQAGEKHGHNEYESALESDDVMPECKLMIRNELLPKIERNQELLAKLQDIQ